METVPRKAFAMKRCTKQFLFAWGPVFFYMGLIWFFSSFPPSGVAGWIDQFPFKDKGVHFIEFGGLCVLLFRALTQTPSSTELKRKLWIQGCIAISMTIAWGMLDEIHQAFVPLREPDAKDVAADALGAFAGAVFYVGLLSFLKHPRVRFNKES